MDTTLWVRSGMQQCAASVKAFLPALAAPDLRRCPPSGRKWTFHATPQHTGSTVKCEDHRSHARLPSPGSSCRRGRSAADHGPG
eukprot:11294909-Prorocentrum_lima.AAC.1